MRIQLEVSTFTILCTGLVLILPNNIIYCNPLSIIRSLTCSLRQFTLSHGTLLPPLFLTSFERVIYAVHAKYVTYWILSARYLRSDNNFCARKAFHNALCWVLNKRFQNIRWSKTRYIIQWIFFVFRSSCRSIFRLSAFQHSL